MATSMISASDESNFEDYTLTAKTNTDTSYQISFQSSSESEKEFKDPKLIDISSLGWHDS